MTPNPVLLRTLPQLCDNKNIRQNYGRIVAEILNFPKLGHNFYEQNEQNLFLFTLRFLINYMIQGPIQKFRFNGFGKMSVHA